MGKRFLYLLVLLCVLLSSCTKPAPEFSLPAETEQQTSPPETLPPTTVAPSAPVTEATIEPLTQPTESHSELYIDGICVEDVILYFNEVCLDAEIIHGGNPSLLQKWTSPISYTIHGDMTEEDYATFIGCVQWLNTIVGFPGMQEAQEAYMSNLDIHFCSQQEMLDLMGSQFFGMDGAVTFWYMDNEIYDAIICYRTDLHQQLRNSVILEEIYNGLGPVQDTAIRSDSIIYAEYSEPQQLSAMDELILKLLYHPQMKCGMSKNQCEQVIRELYY